MKFLVIKHLLVEGLGIFEQFCRDAGIEIDTVELEKGDSFPNLNDYSALWVMGGSMNVDEETEFPWLIEEKALIRKAVREFCLPYMGVCLGAQLLADALGGEVGAMESPEVGLLDINLTAIVSNHPLMKGLSDTFKVLQWHGQEVKQLPADSTILASSNRCQVQAYAVGDRAFGLQFHSEVTHQTVAEWGQIPAYKQDLESALGMDGCYELKQAVEQRSLVMKQEAKILFDNFLNIVKSN